MKKVLCIVICAVMLSLTCMTQTVSASGNTFYVSQQRGNDFNSGTYERPYKTVGKAKKNMQPGDTLILEDGIYTENIVFYQQKGTKSAPYTIKGADGGKAIISAYDPVQTKWTQYSDTIYKTVLPNKPNVSHALWYEGGEFRNMVQARWPNVDADDVLSQQRATAKAGTDENGIYDYKLPAGDWTGAKVYTWTGYTYEQYASFTRTIASYSEQDHLTFDRPVNDGGYTYTPHNGDWYYLTGALCGLDAQREYYYNSATGELYVIMPDGEKPDVDEIWIKTRSDAFDYYESEYINLENLTVLGGGVGVDCDSNYCTMDNVDAFYTNFFDNADGFTTLQKEYNGNHFHGNNNVWKNSEIAYTMTSGIMIAGNNNRVENCYIHDVNWAGGYNSGVFVSVVHSGNVITRNTLTRSGRFLVYFTYDGYDSEIIDTEISYNDISYADMLTCDGGGIYMYHRKAVNSVIRNNWVHDSDYNGSVGIYLDNGTSGMKVFRNVIWNFDAAGIGLNTPSLDNKIYHNTVMNCRDAVAGWPKYADSSQLGTEIKNNMFCESEPLITGALAPVWENNLVSANPPVDSRFLPSSASGAVDAGQLISAVGDGYVGAAPDIGAYETDGVYWVPGALSGTAPTLETMKTVSNGYVVQSGIVTRNEFGAGLPDGVQIMLECGGKLISGSDKAATGMTAIVYYFGNEKQRMTLAVRGDLNGDAAINAADLLTMKRYLLNLTQINGAANEAAKISGRDAVGASDLLALKRVLLGI